MATRDENAAKFQAAAELAHDFANLGPTQDVTTENGPVPSIAKVAATLLSGFSIASDAWLKMYAALPDVIITGTINRDPTTGAITTAGVVWPDGTPGLFTTLTASTAFPGAVDSYKITYGTSPILKTATQPTVTRDATSGAAIARPAITVA